MDKSRAVFLSVLVEPNEDGFLASVPGVQGGFAEGDTIEGAIFNCLDVVKMISAYRTERGGSLGFPEMEIVPDTRFAVTVPVGVA